MRGGGGKSDNVTSLQHAITQPHTFLLGEGEVNMQCTLHILDSTTARQRVLPMEKSHTRNCERGSGREGGRDDEREGERDRREGKEVEWQSTYTHVLICICHVSRTCINFMYVIILTVTCNGYRFILLICHNRCIYSTVVRQQGCQSKSQRSGTQLVHLHSHFFLFFSSLIIHNGLYIGFPCAMS